MASVFEPGMVNKYPNYRFRIIHVLLLFLFTIWFWFLTMFSTIINPFPNKPLFNVSAVQVFENTVGKGEVARNEQFLLFPQCFLPIWRIVCNCHQIWNCPPQTHWAWKSLKLVVWEKVKNLQHNRDVLIESICIQQANYRPNYWIR